MWMLLPAFAFGLLAFIIPRLQANKAPTLLIHTLKVTPKSSQSPLDEADVEVEAIVIYRESFWEYQRDTLIK